MNNIISFGLWGNDPKYQRGAVENAKLCGVIYPGWVCRFYCSKDMPMSTETLLKKLGAEVIRTGKPGTDKTAPYWRLLVAFDTSVCRYIVRDCDSRPNKREAAAVGEWIDSKELFHIMRDHRRHTAPIMGGMWGAVGGFWPGFKKEYGAWVDRVVGGWIPFPRIGKINGDQAFLAQRVWPIIRDKHIAHDNRKSKTRRERPFKIELGKGLFVGQQYDKNNKPIQVR